MKVCSCSKLSHVKVTIVPLNAVGGPFVVKVKVT